MYINEFEYADFQRFLDAQNKHINTVFNSPLARVEKAGEGNMNFTFRLISESNETLIIKQSPPYCAKFPQIEAPQQRILVESQFYALVHGKPEVAGFFPKVIHTDEQSHAILLEDLGNARDFTSLYKGESLTIEQAQQIIQTLSAINSIALEQPIENTGMRTLNHAHIFEIPLVTDNGLDLNQITAGLQDSAKLLINDAKYKKLAHELGQQYLSSGQYLLHGDYYPGSWLACRDKIAVIDPEFCFTGSIEFDLGVLLAHLVLSDQHHSVLSTVLDGYRPAKSIELDLALMFCGIEIMRRLIGYAQLPLDANLSKKHQWLQQSMELVRAPKTSIVL